MNAARAHVLVSEKASSFLFDADCVYTEVIHLLTKQTIVMSLRVVAEIAF